MKNTMSLENYGVAALTTREMKTTNGGFHPAIIVGALVISFAVGVYNGYQDAKAEAANSNSLKF